MVILGVCGRQIYDSRGKPTVEAEVTTEKGEFRASVPSGVSASLLNEALEVRDGGPEFNGKGVQTALYNINDCIGPDLVQLGLNPQNQQIVDSALIAMDGTANRSKHGVNAIAPVSMAVCRAGAVEKGIPLYQHIAGLMGILDLTLPIPVFNMINGGIHACNLLPFQEFVLIPKGASSYSEAMNMGVEMYHHLKCLIQRDYGYEGITVADQGGFCPPIATVEEALDLLVYVINESGYQGKVTIGVDAAATEFYRDGKYDLNYKVRKSRIRKLINSRELQDLYLAWIKDYPITMVEDPFSFGDWKGFTELTRNAPGISILGDDLTVTNGTRINSAVKRNACNGFLIKLNQAGTVTDVMNACQVANAQGWATMISHRSGETEDPFIADLAVGVKASYIKAGAPCRSERTCKYNQLLRIEEELGSMASYAGAQLIQTTEV